jgi:hypothetical protein
VIAVTASGIKRSSSTVILEGITFIESNIGNGSKVSRPGVTRSYYVARRAGVKKGLGRELLIVKTTPVSVSNTATVTPQVVVLGIRPAVRKVGVLIEGGRILIGCLGSNGAGTLVCESGSSVVVST